MKIVVSVKWLLQYECIINVKHNHYQKYVPIYLSIRRYLINKNC